MSSGSITANDTHPPLITALSHAEAYPHSVDNLQIIETHISWVFLTGHYAYKIKKPVNFGFLDFSTLEKRQHFCEEELRLNRRLASSLYLSVVPISGPAQKATIKRTDEPIEYAVKMLQFDTTNTFDQLLLAEKLTTEHISETAETLAIFHANILIAEKKSTFGNAEAIQHPVMENFEQLSTIVSEIKNQHLLPETLQALHEWTIKKHESFTPIFNHRKNSGFVRECHGDLHLRNITLWKDHVTLFDCIEFNDNLRWIDVVSELAFLLMDLDDHHQSMLSRQLLNHYLSLTGDYEGLTLLRYYQVYRAMVRAKVAGLRINQNTAKTTQQLNEINRYIYLAKSYTNLQPPILFITHGLSGSGKTYTAKELSLSEDIIHLRSDIERKRYFDLAQNAKSHSKTNEGIYSPEATEKVYGHLLRLTQSILDAGFSVVVDATFLQRQHRNIFKSLADEASIPFAILHCEASNETLHQRLQQRENKGTDASEANESILAQQQQKPHSLENDEWRYAQTIHPEDTDAVKKVLFAIPNTRNNPPTE